MNKIIYFVIVCILLLKVNFFYLIPFPDSIQSFNTDHQNIMVVFVILVTIFLFFTFMFKNKKYYLGNFILVFIILSFVELLYSMYMHNQSFIDVLIAGNYSFLVLAYFIFAFY